MRCVEGARAWNSTALSRPVMSSPVFPREEAALEGSLRREREPCSERERLPERSLPPEYVPTRK